MQTATSGLVEMIERFAPGSLPGWQPKDPASRFARHRLRFARRRLEAHLEPVAGERGHGSRVAILSEAVAIRLGYARPDHAYEAGRLHDVGKAALAFDPTVLPRALTRDERAEVEHHPELGALLVAEAGYPADVVAAVLLHHERLDGSGYPYGLSGAAVPLLAQIVAAVDVFDALTSARCYKDPWCRELVLRFGEAQRGQWFRTDAWEALIAVSG